MQYGSQSSRLLVALCMLVLASSTALALIFDLPAFPASAGHKHCLSTWVAKGTQVKVTAKADPGPNQRVELVVTDDSDSNNEYLKKVDLTDAVAMFASHSHASIDVCFRNILDEGYQQDGRFRTIHLTVDAGASTVDYKRMQIDEKLKPLEVELRKIENLLEEVSDAMVYLKNRESKMRDTNESTNERIKWLSILVLVVTVVFGITQVLYLRNFFISKKLV
ncbi:ERV25 protein [Ramicandelaber brevisporus]|nr:ERV25 protein [Ramicandelaber brevisporus]